MLNTIVAGIILAALTGLTTLAYKEPKAYRKLHNFIWPGLLIIFILYFVFNLGVMSGQSRMTPYIALDKFEEALRSRESGDHFLLAFGIYFGLTLYLGFLRYLGKLVGRGPDEPESGIFIGWISDRNKSSSQKKPSSEENDARLK